MATRLVIPEIDSDEGYEQPIDIHADGLGSAGFYPQHPLDPADMDAGIERDASDNLILKDPNAGPHTLLSLLGGGFDPNKMVMESDGKLVFIGDGDIVLRT